MNNQDFRDLFSSYAHQDEEPVLDEDEALEQFENVDVKPVKKENVEKKGEMAPIPTVAGMKRSRDVFLAEMKAQRQVRKSTNSRMTEIEPTKSYLKRSKVAESGPTQYPGSQIEIDRKGREVLITVDEHGKVKRKVKKGPVKDSQDVAASDRIHGEEQPFSPKVDTETQASPKLTEVETRPEQDCEVPKGGDEVVDEKDQKRKKKKKKPEPSRWDTLIEMDTDRLVPITKDMMEWKNCHGSDSDDDDEIFKGAGFDYDPLAGLEAADDSGDEHPKSTE